MIGNSPKKTYKFLLLNLILFWTAFLSQFSLAFSVKFPKKPAALASLTLIAFGNSGRRIRRKIYFFGFLPFKFQANTQNSKFRLS